MRALIQRVLQASVSIGGCQKSSIGQGLLVLVGFEEADGDDDLKWMVSKLVSLRIFDDHNGVMNLSLRDTGGAMLVVSQFTLFAQTRKGNRPSYINPHCTPRLPSTPKTSKKS
jgi:D-tyrosyl-tRNA(Tyr) deacylase